MIAIDVILVKAFNIFKKKMNKHFYNLKNPALFKLND